MYGMLATGVANRAVTTRAVNIPDPPAGADLQQAAPLPRVTLPPSATAPALNQNVARVAWDMAATNLTIAGLSLTQRKKT
jgi:hypothetical protein